MKLLFLFVLITMLVQTQLNAQTTPADFIANVPPAGRMLFRRLETGHLYCGEDSEEIIKLSKVGGITLPLMDLIKKTYREHGDENVGRSTLYALDQRVDLTEEDIAWVRGMLDEMLNYTHQDGFAHIFKEQGLFLLRHYPSPANEDILIKYLQPNNVQNVISFGYASAIGLNLIGTSKSLAALEAFRKTCDARFDDYKDATQAITRINEREGLKDRTPHEPAL